PQGERNRRKGRLFRRPHPLRRAPGRPADGSAHAFRAAHQSQDRAVARSLAAADARRARRRGDRVSARMRRREFITLIAGAAAAWPRAAGGQQRPMPVIGYLSGGAPDGPFVSFLAAFRQGLGEIGYVEGQNVAFEYRWAEGHYDRLPALAVELVEGKVDLIAA